MKKVLVFISSIALIFLLAYPNYNHSPIDDIPIRLVGIIDSQLTEPVAIIEIQDSQSQILVTENTLIDSDDVYIISFIDSINNKISVYRTSDQEIVDLAIKSSNRGSFIAYNNSLLATQEVRIDRQLQDSLKNASRFPFFARIRGDNGQVQQVRLGNILLNSDRNLMNKYSMKSGDLIIQESEIDLNNPNINKALENVSEMGTGIFIYNNRTMRKLEFS